MATITPQAVTAAGSTETLQAATANDTIVNATPTTRYRVATTGTSTTITFTGVAVCPILGITHNITWGPLTGTATYETLIPTSVIAANNSVAVAHSATTGVTVGAFQ